MLMSDPQRASSAEIFERHREALVKLAEGILGDNWRAEDVVQEVFLRVVKQSLLDTVADPFPYLFKMVRNLSIDELRRRGREKSLLREDGQTAPGGVTSIEFNPEEIAVARDDYRAFLAALDELPTQTRRAVVMYFVDGKKMAEVARRLNVSVGKTHAMITQGIAHCKHKLGRE